MVFVHAGVVIGVYLSSHFWKKRKRARMLALTAPDANQQEPQNTEMFAEAQQNRFDLAEDRHQFRVGAATLLTTSAGHFIYPPISILNLALITYGVTPIIGRAVSSLQKQQRVQNDVYSAVVSVLCVACGQYFAAAINGTVYHLSNQKIRESREEASEHISDAFDQLPMHIWVLCDGIEIQKPLAELCVNEIVVANLGEIIPVNGEVVSGCAVVDQQAATGEMQPVDVVPGDHVLAQSCIISGRLHIRATDDGQTSQSRQLHQLMQNTRDYKTRLQLKGEAWADRAALPTLAISAAVWPLFGLVPATAILFSLPANSARATLATQTGTCLRQMSQHGVLVRDGRVFENIPWIDVILFDKTGTLTETTPEVVAICRCSVHTENELLQLAAASEQHLHHPVADALRQEAAARNLQLPEADDVSYEPGCGIRACIAGRQIYVGNVRFMHDYLGTDETPPEIQHFVQPENGHNYVHVAIDGELVGVIELRPALRAEAIACINKLRERGFHNLQIVSGDTQEACEYFNRQLNLDACHGGMLPEDKVALIRQMQSQGHRVCFIGDGLNDVVAMKQANVSISLGSAAEVTCGTAQIVLVRDNLMDIHAAMDMAMLLQLRLAGDLGLWLAFGAMNAVFVPLLHFTPLQSGLLFGSAFGYFSHKAEKSIHLRSSTTSDADHKKHQYGMVKKSSTIQPVVR